MSYRVIYPRDIPYPGLKFKVKYADGTFPEKGKSTMTLQGILMSLEVLDTKEELTYKKAFAQVSGV